MIKAEADLSLNLPNEVIRVDDDIDITEISYLSKLLERLDDINICERRLALLENIVPIETIDLVCSDSDAENAEMVRHF